MQMILQELMSILASEAVEEKAAENQDVTIDEEDELERAKLPEYIDLFKVSLIIKRFYPINTHLLYMSCS